MAVVPDDREPLSPQAADLIRGIARMVLDEPADLMKTSRARIWPPIDPDDLLEALMLPVGALTAGNR